MNPQQGRVEYKDIPVTVNRDIDILFVIDDSPSMLDKQTNLARNFPDFINVLQTIPGGLPNVHLGVASSDMGTAVQGGSPAPSIGSGQGSCSNTKGKNGALQTGMAGGTVTGAFISDVSAGPGMPRQTNYGDPSTLATVFGQMAQIGANGCGFEQHLEAAKTALSPSTAANQGFLRQNAYLAIIFIADEDDCSIKDGGLLGPESPALGPLQSFRCNRYGHICDQGGADPTAMNQVGAKGQCHPADNSQYLTKVSEYVTYFKGLKADPDSVIVAGIMGTTTPYSVELRSPPGGGTAQPAVAHSCSYTGANGLEVADPPTRIQFLLDQFPGRSTFTTICQTNLSDGLQLIAQLLKAVIGDPCITGNLADVDPTKDGDQYDCSVSFVQDQGKPTQKETVIPACNDARSNKPCWYLEMDPECTEGEHVKLKVEGQESAPPNTHIIANCVTGDDAMP
ncbi:MAG: VWA domain-containing protein [Deltaproteobacteria bacterium]|nr:VWA domain-containing protein [Deltaproteobacteria bacterium]